MSYDENPIELKGQVKIMQVPLSSVGDARSSEGMVRASLVYVRVQSEAGPLLVPFGDYDDWSLRDRYNEAIRIMNTLGASEITCETFREVTVRRGFRAKVLKKGGEISQERIENSGFDFSHVGGGGSAPRDPRPLRWPDEPGFSAAVSSVLENRATRVVIDIRSNRTHAIDGSLGLKLKGVGFDLGGHSHKAGATSLHISASFPEAKKGGSSRRGPSLCERPGQQESDGEIPDDSKVAGIDFPELVEDVRCLAALSEACEHASREVKSLLVGCDLSRRGTRFPSSSCEIVACERSTSLASSPWVRSRVRQHSRMAQLRSVMRFISSPWSDVWVFVCGTQAVRGDFPGGGDVPVGRVHLASAEFGRGETVRCPEARSGGSRPGSRPTRRAQSSWR